MSLTYPSSGMCGMPRCKGNAAIEDMEIQLWVCAACWSRMVTAKSLMKSAGIFGCVAVIKNRVAGIV